MKLNCISTYLWVVQYLNWSKVHRIMNEYSICRIIFYMSEAHQIAQANFRWHLRTLKHVSLYANNGCHIVVLWHSRFSSLAPGRFGNDFKSVILQHMLLIKFMSISGEIALMWMPQNTFDDRPILIRQYIAWRRQAISHHLNLCWTRSQAPYGATRFHWTKTSIYRGLNKVTHFADEIFKCVYQIEIICGWVWISMKSLLVRIMPWHRTCEKPLPEPTLTMFYDDIWRHYRLH